MVYLDFLRVGKQLTPKQWQKHISKKYQKVKFDGIYANGVYAIDLLKSFGDNFAPNVPKIYNDTDAKAAKNELNLSINRERTVSKTLDLAFKLHPNAKKVYTIDGTWEDTKYLNKLLPEKLKKYPHMEHIRIKNYSFEELYEKVKSIEKDSILIPAILYKDKNKEINSPIDIIKKIAEINKDIPIYSFLTTHLKANITGGYMFNGSINAKTAVEAILDYNKNNSFTKNYKYLMHTYLNWESIDKLNIDLTSIPDDAIILNKPKTILQSYFYEVISTAIFVIFLIFLLISLLYLVYKLKDTNIRLQVETEDKLAKEKLLTQQTKNALMGEMVSNIAHQWRQPLNRINSNVAVIDLRQQKLKFFDENIEEKLQNIEEQTSYMSKTIDDFFQFISGDKTKDCFYVSQTIEKALYLLNTRFENINVIFDLDDNIKLNSYENEFSQVILSILNNALDHFKIRQTQNPEVIITLKEQKKNILVEICDNAGGIEESIIPKIFDANFSTKNNTNSNGLGLYISKNIIENSMKGEIKASNKNDGACFSIYFSKEELTC